MKPDIYSVASLVFCKTSILLSMSSYLQMNICKISFYRRVQNISLSILSLFFECILWDVWACIYSEYEYIQNSCICWVLYWWFMIFLVSNELFFINPILWVLVRAILFLGLSVLSVLLLFIVTDLGNFFQWTTFSVVTAFYPLPCWRYINTSTVEDTLLQNICLDSECST